MLTPDERAWKELLAYVEDGKVIPVVGPELLTVPTDQGDVGLYRVIAERLARELQLDPQPRSDLNAVVCAYLTQVRGARVDDLYLPINDILKELKPPVPEALRRLAAIRSLDLFVTTTFDSLLVEALNQVRFGGAPRTLQLTYAPNLGTDDRHDIPARAEGKTVVFHLFGKASSSPDYAIHEEDTLEFIHTILSGRDPLPKRLSAELTQRNLLIIGCPFPDWLSRFFIRMASSKRLSDNRSRKEFIATQETAQDPSLTLFLEHFSHNTKIIPGNAVEFVTELHRCWSERNPAQPAGASAPAAAPTLMEKGAIFISYARQDAAAAQALSQAVREIGGDVHWIDKERIEPGDEWKEKILQSIQREARLFLPLISLNTEARKEGVFRREWREAVERAMAIQGRDFIVPVIVDADYEPGRYRLVPEAFRRLDFGWAPGGKPDPRLLKKIKEEIRNLQREEAR